jgi:ABC-type amino acid transport substrate-binding protein
LVPTQSESQNNIISRIQDRGRIKIGFDDEALPFSFFNSKGQLVGYDIFFAHRLAKNLGVSIDFIHLDRSQVKECLEKGICDIVMSAFPIRLDELGRLNFTQPYMETKSAFIVKDYRKRDFQKLSDVKSMTGVRIAVTPENSNEERRLISTELPNAEIVELENIKTFFEKEDIADALLTTDKIGKAWALLYPIYGVAVPMPNLFVYELAYSIPITLGDDKFLDYLNHWLSLEKTNEELTRQFDYWILGKTPERKVPRWSIIRNVLGWVD